MTEFYLQLSVRYTYPSPAKKQRSEFSGVHCCTTRLIGNILTGLGLTVLDLGYNIPSAYISQEGWILVTLGMRRDQGITGMLVEGSSIRHEVGTRLWCLSRQDRVARVYGLGFSSQLSGNS